MSNSSQHPEFKLEINRLQKVIKYIWQELYGVESAPPIYGHKIELRARHSSLNGRKKVLFDALQSSPYFGRFDFQEAGCDEIEEFYISKLQNLGLLHGPVRVIYWASPIGGLFSQTTRAKVTYVAPQGEIYGDVFLRRQLLINQGHLDRIIDEFDRRKKQSPEIEEKILYINPDEYLRLVLEGKRGRGLSEVVASIQERQNEIMRSDPNQILIVQGPAGSGKTTIALHRVAILLYVPEDEQQKDPKRLMVIGANRFFLRFVSQVLPGININNVPQRTFIEWAANFTGIKAFHDFQDTTREEVFLPVKDANSDIAKTYFRSKLKGSLQIITWLEKLSEQYRIRTKPNGVAVYPVGKGALGVFYTIAEHQINEIIKATQDEPINRQRDIVVSKIIDQLASHHEQNYRAWTNRIAAILNAPPSELDVSILRNWEQQLEEYGFRRINGKIDVPSFQYEDQVSGAERRRERALRSIRDEIAQLVSNEFERYDALDVYVDFLSDGYRISNVLGLPNKDTIQRKVQDAERILQDNKRNQADYRSVLDTIENIRTILNLRTSGERRKSQADRHPSISDLPNLRDELTQIDESLQIYNVLFQEDIAKVSLRVEDIAPITLLYLLFEGRGNDINDYDHIIVDEAQDMSPLEMWLLRKVVSSGSMTILGDLAQSIHSYRGITTWDEFEDVFSNDRLTYEKIERTYRSTHEIMTFANKILENRILRQFNYQRAEPFARHGESVRAYGVQSFEVLLEKVEKEIKAFKVRGLATIAIISKTIEECRIIYAHLHKVGFPVELVIDDISDYGSELIAIPVFLAKGIEFDACIISNANRENYPSDDLHGRLLYVAITRALHELVVLWNGLPSEHLPVEFGSEIKDPIS